MRLVAESHITSMLGFFKADVNSFQNLLPSQFWLAGVAAAAASAATCLLPLTPD